MTTQLKNFVRVVKDTDTEKAETLIREYKQTRWAANSERMGKSDSLSAWYSIEEIENFLALAKANGGDGIKFYYGAFPGDHKAEPSYAGRQTLVGVATKSKRSVSDGLSDKDIYIRKGGQTKILNILSPRLCPPNCGSNPEGGTGDLGITIIDKGEKGMEII